MFNVLLPAAIAGTDSLIKKQREENDTVYEYLDGKIKIVTFHNKGAFLGGGKKKPVLVAFMSVVFTAIVATVFILTLTKRGLNMLKFGLGLLLGGAFSNTYDRIKKGYVTDYMVFEHAPGFLKNVVFNLSDFAIIIGALISALQ
jgi:signal peptidase II